MTQIDDSTQPKRPENFPPQPDPDYPDGYDGDDEDNNGPGCMVWGVIGVFGLIVSIVIVIIAGLAGFNSGLSTARVTATAVRFNNIATQCRVMSEDIAAGRLSLVERRMADISQNGVVPPCAQPLIMQATEAALTAVATQITPTATATDLPTATPTEEPASANAEPTVAASATSTGGYDLDALLAEARASLSTGDYDAAIRTFDAIIAIDPSYQTTTISGLLFNALTARAQFLYISGGSLSQAILLTNRAEQYGNIDQLGYERSVAQLYLNAQAFINVDYGRAINYLVQVRALSTDYRNTNRLLFTQYVAYGDAFALSGESCRAEQQYTAALGLFQEQAVITKRNDAQTACLLGVTAVPDGGTPQEGATPDPNAQPTVAPVGQQ